MFLISYLYLRRFWSLLENGMDESEVFRLAKAKLCGSSTFGYSEITLPGRVAVLDVLLQFDYEPSRESARRMVLDQIKGHLRLAYSVTSDRDVLRSGYSSEPLIAEAALALLKTWDGPSRSIDSQYDILDTIVAKQQDGLLDSGKIGELLGRDRLLKAFRRAVEEEIVEEIPVTCYYSRGCKLPSFIKQLFAQDFSETIFSSLPDTIGKGQNGSRPFKDVFDNAVVRLTHFVKFNDDSAFSLEAFLAMYLRGAGIICRENQKAVDAIIPICRTPENPSAEQMTAIFVQMKAQKKQSSKTHVVIDRTKLRRSLQDIVHWPYISLVMDMAVSDPSQQETEVPTSYPNTGRKAPKSGQKAPGGSDPAVQVSTAGIHHHLDEGPARYAIFVYGLDDRGYANMAEAQVTGYSIMLGKSRLLASHPHQENAALEALLRMKPFFSGGRHGFHWIRDEWLAPDNLEAGIPQGDPEEEA